MQIVEPDPAAIWQFPGIFPVPKNIRNGDLASEVALKVSGRELPVSVQLGSPQDYGECRIRVGYGPLVVPYISVWCRTVTDPSRKYSNSAGKAGKY